MWQGPLTLSKDEVSNLKSIGVRQIFIRAGTFTSDGNHLFLVIPQKWISNAGGLKCHLVFNFDSGVISHFSHYDLETMASEIRDRVEKQIEAARKAGVAVSGVQFDFDVPTSKLTRYADLLRSIRSPSPELRKGGQIAVSATGLVTWLRSPGLLDVSRELDFLAPQFYEGVTSRTLDKMTPISDLDAFKENVHRADRLACPYYVGIPAYGHALLYDEAGLLRALYPGLPPADALRHPFFRLETAYPSDRLGKRAGRIQDWAGEEMLKFRAIHADRNGRGLGYTLAYTIPTAELLRRYMEVAKTEQSSRCLGAILFRYPEAGQSLALPIPTVQAVLQDRVVAPKLEISARGQADTFDMIDAPDPSSAAPTDAYLVVKNVGNAPTFVAPDAVLLRVAFDQGGFDDIRRRDMDAVRRLDDRTLEFTKGYLAPGQTLRVGPIRLLGKATRATLSWRLREADGFGVVSEGPIKLDLTTGK